MSELENTLRLDLFSVADIQELQEIIARCEGKHVQQVAYSTHHKGMTRICFGCMTVDSTLPLNVIK